MMGKFSPQLKELPGAVDMSGSANSQTTSQELGSGVRPTTMKIPAMTTAPGNVAAPQQQDEDHLRVAQSLLEREVTRAELTPPETEALREVLFGLRERNVQRVASIWRDAFAEVTHGSEALRIAAEHLEKLS